MVPVRVAAAAADAAQPRTFQILAYTGEPMNIWPYEHPVIVDLASMDLSVPEVPALYDHAPWIDAVIGQVTKQELTPEGLVCSGVFTIDAQMPHERNCAAQVVAKADAGYRWQGSIGGNPATLEQIQAGASVNVNGRDHSGPCFVARGVSLREVSFVVLGGDRRTRAIVARSGMEAAMSFEEWLLTLGFEDPAALSEVQRANLTKVYQAENPDAAADDAAATTADADTPATDDDEETPPANAAARAPALQARRQAEAAETARVNEIRRLCAAADNPTMILGTGASQRTVDIAAHAIGEGWPVQECRREIELQELRASRTKAPAVFSHSRDRDCTLQAMQGALLLRAGSKIGFRLDYKFQRVTAAYALKLPAWLRAGVNEVERNRIMDAAHAYAGMSGIDICREACRLDGIDAPRDYSELVRAAIAGPAIRAASSGSSLANIFSTSVNAMLLMSYEQSEDTTVGWVSETDVGNFQTQERTRLDLGGGLKKRPRGKSAEHADYTDSQETYKIAPYAKQFEVDEVDLVNDNLSGLDTVPREMGQASARLRPDLVYSIILANANLGATGRQLFNTTDGNLPTGAALASASLRTGIQTMAGFRENSVNLNLRPTHLIVGQSNMLLSWELTQSPQLLYGADDETVRGNLNPIKAQGITPVTEARLENGVTDPDTGDAQTGSTTAWYLACATAHTIEVGYLRGTGRAPRVRSFVLDKGRYGLGWDVDMSIGAKALDWKGLVKNAGA